MAGDSLLWAGKESKVMKITGHKMVDKIIISSWLESKKQQMLA